MSGEFDVRKAPLLLVMLVEIRIPNLSLRQNVKSVGHEKIMKTSDISILVTGQRFAKRTDIEPDTGPLGFFVLL